MRSLSFKLFCIFLLAVINANAQFSFSKTYGDSNNIGTRYDQEIYFLEEVSDGFVAVGTTSYDSFFTHQVLKTNKKGDTIFIKNLINWKQITPTELSVPQFMVTDTVSHIYNFYFLSDSQASYRLVKSQIDYKGHILGEFHYKLPAFLDTFSIYNSKIAVKPGPNNSFTLIASKLKTPYLFLLDSVCRLIHQVKIPDEPNNIFNMDGAFIKNNFVLCIIRSFFTPNTQGVKLYSIDSTGSISGSKFISLPYIYTIGAFNSGGTPPEVDIRANANSAVIGLSKIWDTAYKTTRLEPYFIKINENLDTLWTKLAVFSDTGTALYPGSVLFCFGYSKNSSIIFLRNINPGFTYGRIISRMDSTGKIISNTSLDTIKIRFHRINSLLVTDDGGFAMAGIAYVKSSFGFSKYCIVKKDLSVFTGIDEEGHLDEVKGYLAFPNPANSSISLKSGKQKIAAINVYDEMGRPVRSYSDLDALECEIPRGNLPSGMYFLKIRSKEDKTYITKVIWK